MTNIRKILIFLLVIITFGSVIFMFSSNNGELKQELRSVGIKNVGKYTYSGYDTHGGFHGDGDSFYCIEFDDIEKLEKHLEELVEKSSGWHEFPMDANMIDIMFWIRNEEYKDETLVKEISEIANGYWYFCDRHAEATSASSPSEVFALSRYSKNYTAAIYDLDNKILYYVEVDT